MSHSPRRSRPIAIGLTIVGLLFGTSTVVTAASSGHPADSPNLLDRPRADVAVLEPVGGEERLLVVGDPSFDLPAPSVRLEVLGRAGDGVWASLASLDVALPAVDGSWGRPWLIGLEGGAHALIVGSQLARRSVITDIAVTTSRTVTTLATGRQRDIAAVIDDAGSADIDGDGQLELVLASARTERRGDLCQGSRLWVLEPDSEAARVIDVPNVRLAAGVFGRFDAVAGDDLAVYAWPNCPAGPDFGPELRSLLLHPGDGRIVADRPIGVPDPPPWTPPPIRLDVDGDGRHELLGLASRGLSIIDPADVGAAIRLASSRAIPLGVVPVDPPGPSGPPRVRVAWFEPSIGDRTTVGTELVRREADGSLDSGPAIVRWDDRTSSDRWQAAALTTIWAALAQSPPTGWVGPLGDPACADLLVPMVRVSCATDEVVPGVAWIGTRPLLVVSPQRSRLLVAVGIDGGEAPELPRTPTPWAGGPEGWWRHGPSAPFVLAELDARDVSPQPAVIRPAIDPSAAAGPAITFGGRPGVRLLVSVRARDPDDPDPVPYPELGAVLGRAAPPQNSLVTVLRVPVPPGSSSGGRWLDLTLDIAGGPARRWDVTTVPLDDRGEIGLPVVTAVRRDETAPRLEMAAPAVTPVWPFPARLSGIAEPGSVLHANGVGPLEIRRRGAFEFETTLAPWPQTIELVAVDASGNTSRLHVSVIGGVDYRTLPWPTILAVLVIAAVTVSGVIGARRRGDRPGSIPETAMPWETGPLPELEELPSGHGLRRDR